MPAARRVLLPVPAPYILLAALFAAASGYIAAVADVLRLVPSGELARRLSADATVGWPPVPFERIALPVGIVMFIAGIFAARGRVDSLGPIALTPGRRIALTNAPTLATLFTLSLDDGMRRGCVIALGFGVSAALATFFSVEKTTGSSFDPSLERWDPPGRRAGWPAWREALRPHAAILVAILVHAVAFSFFTIRRDQALWSATVDLGIFKEALWNTLHGRVMYSPTVGYSFLGEHFSPVLFLMLPFYAVSPSSATILIIQACAISAAAWPIYRLGLANGLGRALSTVVATSMVFAAAMQHSLMYDFHMDLLGVPFLAWAILCAHERRWRSLAVWAALLCTVKEEAFVSMTGLALATYFGDPTHPRKQPAVLALGVLAWCALAIAVFIHAFGPPPGVPVYMGGAPGEYKFMRNFGHLNGPGGPAVQLLTHPLRYLYWMLSEGRLTTLFVLFVPVLAMPLFAGGRVFLLTPLAILLLTDNHEITQMHYHYGAMQHPGVYAAAVYGMAFWLARSDAKRAAGQEGARSEGARWGMSAGVVVASAVMLGVHPGSVMAREAGHDQRHVTEHTHAVDRILANVPADAPVSATSFGGPRLSNRRELWLFPQGLDRATWAYVDMQRPAWPTNPEGRDDTVMSMLRSGWAAVAWESGAVVMRKTATLSDADRARNRQAVRDLFLHRVYEVEGVEQTDFPGAVEHDANASEGYARVVYPTDRRPGEWVVFGPFARLPAGRFRVTFRLRADPTTFPGEPGAVDVFASGSSLANHPLTGEDFPDANWHDVSLEFAGGRGGTEFRVRTYKSWVLAADRISLEPLDGDDAALRGLGF